MNIKLEASPFYQSTDFYQSKWTLRFQDPEQDESPWDY